jgi:hypothetical protein
VSDVGVTCSEYVAAIAGLGMNANVEKRISPTMKKIRTCCLNK